MVPEEPWDLSRSFLYCKMGALLLLLLPDILSPFLSLACQDIYMLQEAFLDSTPHPPPPREVVRAPPQGQENLHCGTQSYQLGLSTHQTVRRTESSSSPQCSAGYLDPIGTLFNPQIFTKHGVAEKTE